MKQKGYRITDGTAMVFGDLTADKVTLYANLIGAPLPFPLAIVIDGSEQAS